eukprot:Opistho-1_new@33548
MRQSARLPIERQWNQGLGARTAGATADDSVHRPTSAPYFTARQALTLLASPAPLRRINPAARWNSALPAESHRFPMQPRRLGNVPQPFGPLFVAALVSAAVLYGGAAHAAEVRTDHVAAELVAERSASAGCAGASVRS